jgi:PIN domain nuclease of toxin-antitoxin system
VRLLLDTHSVIWWVTDDPTLSASARQAIADRRNSVHISVGTLWEIALKVNKGKLRLFDGFDAALDQEPFTRLDIAAPHVRAAAGLPMIHTDPFDRLLVAQSRIEQLTLVTRDSMLSQYGVVTLAA